MNSNERFHLAAKAIERFGIIGLSCATEHVGAEAAWALVIAHVRRIYGSLETSPPRPEIDAETNEVLRRTKPCVYDVLSKSVALFYASRWYCFDNFSAFAVNWRGRLYPTVEHAYQASKFFSDASDPFRFDGVLESISEHIRAAPSAHDAKLLGNDARFVSYKRTDWGDEVKLQNMEDILRAKYAQHEYVRRKLTQSKGMILVEDSNEDSFWGRGPNWDGLNWQGRLWMKIRDE